MSERPILFSGPMVQAILDGNKTQTRRIVKLNGAGRVARAGKNWHLDDKDAVQACRYGQVGDRLWVREAWQVDAPRDGTWADTQFYGCKGSPLSDIPARYQKPGYCLFRASWTGTPIIWSPSIHMPRWASRITLEITEVRVQRLQEISYADAIAEGVSYDKNPSRIHGHWSNDEGNPVYQFKALWDSIKGTGSWAENPWMWCVSFKKVQP